MTTFLGVVTPITLTILIPLATYTEAIEKGTEMPWLGALMLFIFMSICTSVVVRSALAAPKLKSRER